MLSEKEFRRRIFANLHFLRTCYGYTQQQIASLLGCERSTYTHLERGKTLLSVYHLYVLSEFYRLPPEAMWSDLQTMDISRLREKQGP
ncbi:helix-turn-helix transcriptional regulator [Neglectibacter timonensis]|uniref:helix-turn-helix transcriptional regulator n=1 Tax=Neglectibacter timonensis TaxID=1776382 RepID=UPI0034E61BBE